jgi:hypothetical protein
VLYSSFRKARAIVLGIAITIPVLVYGIAEIIETTSASACPISACSCRFDALMTVYDPYVQK